jgi:transcription-repair coupling factor (superfamily II helicase)
MKPLDRHLLELATLLSPSGPPPVQGAAFPYLLAAFLKARRGPVVIVTPDMSGARRLHQQVAGLAGVDAPLWFPPPDADPYEGLPDHPGVLLERSLALCHLGDRPVPALLIPAESLLWRVPRSAWWRDQIRTLEEGKILERGRFRVQAWRLGYRAQDTVSEPGDFALRGGIVDVFPAGEDLPVRAELFGDEVETLRFFDPSSQRSLGRVGRPVRILPLSEAVRDEGLLGSVRDRLRLEGPFGEVRLDTLEAAGSYPSFPAEMRIERDFFGPLWDHLPGATWIWTDRAACRAQAARQLERWRESHARHGRPIAWAPDALFEDQEGLPPEASADLPEIPEWARRAQRPRLFPGEPLTLLAHLREKVSEGYRALLLFQGHGTLERAQEMAEAEGIALLGDAPGGDLPPGLTADLASCEEGVDIPDLRWIAITEKEIFGRGRTSPEASVKRREVFFATLRDIKEGDPIVHLDHGIGLYQGMETLVRGGIREDYLILQYAGRDKLLVPVQRMDLVQKYVGAEGHQPALDKLGGTTWKKAKEKVRKATREMAGDLMKLYTTRRAAERPAYSPDTHWQEEFESQFPFELTPDQEKAIQDVKRDMEGAKPMDRIICGDVGFGKTEVAMRAAFKAVMEGRQVAVLCPTTVLALQHMERFTERFAPFPAKVAMLSRFQDAREQRAVIATGAAGKLDVVIGTHRLLSKDVDLPRLGLLVVDEEQRFGVAQKEKIKQWSARVDVLTLTATPIPRTLQMGLSNVLDMSLIQTSPRDRLSIQTVVHEMDRELVEAAIRRELARGGQVFFVHNHVQTIATCAHALKEWVPEARVAVAHGQMGEKALEEVMIAFFHGEYDILVCTTIIENGVDVARANTLLVENAQNFGLCQLYQLRGRIGRSDLPAYAYLLTPERALPEGDAARRLETLQEFSELGAGFRVAAVDLSLRGAGDFLGTRQSGHIDAVGFELYLRMLEEAVEEFRGEAPRLIHRCEMNLGLELSIPMEYIEEVNQRLCAYRDLSLAVNGADVDAVERDLQDRFGTPPGPVRRMLDAVRLRILAERSGVVHAAAKGSTLKVAYTSDHTLDPARLQAFARARTGVTLNPDGAVAMVMAPGEDPLALFGRFLSAVSTVAAGVS